MRVCVQVGDLTWEADVCVCVCVRACVCVCVRARVCVLVCRALTHKFAVTQYGMLLSALIE